MDPLVERVTEMEGRFRRAEQAMDALEQAAEDMGAALPGLEQLAAWYDSPQWLLDYQAEESGALPEDMPRGVLSQDGVWDLLQRWAGLRRTLAELTGGDG